MKSADTHCPVLIQSLLDPANYSDAVHHCELIETHISWVFLTDSHVYKIKKPVNFGFLDFSSLQKRQYYCDEELRLNRRLAPEIYLSVVAITGTYEHPTVEGSGVPIEYAVKMAPFPQECQLDKYLANGQLHTSHMEAFGKAIADFHQNTDRADEKSDYGDFTEVILPVEENFSQIRKFLHDPQTAVLLTDLESWSKEKSNALKSVFIARKKQGFIRECHGDMHLRNLAWFNNKPLVFDCIEFNPALRWIDVISDVAFLVMDLQDRGEKALAQQFLNSYLEYSGDYAGVRILSFYLVYRAMVRAKVASIRLGQEGLTVRERNTIQYELKLYLQLATDYTQQTEPKLIITYGMSGSGKSSVTKTLLGKIGAIRIRSDLERKRIYGKLKQGASNDIPISAGGELYSSEATSITYNRLAELARQIIDGGFSVIVDATFLDKANRDDFRRLAENRGVRFIILEFMASTYTLRSRIRQRSNDISDADIAVLEMQLMDLKPISYEENAYLISVDTEKEINFDDLMLKINCQSH